MSTSIAVRKLDRGQYAIRAGYFSRALVDASKGVPGMRYDGALGWVGHADAAQCVVEALEERGITCEGEVGPPGAWRTSTITIPVAKAGKTKTLRAYQNEGVKFLIAKAAEGCILADGMRTGKTATSVVAARAFKQKTLITCPPHAVGVWARPPDHPKPGEIAEWWPDAWKANGGKGVVVLEGVEPAKAQDVFEKLSEKKPEKRTPAEVKSLEEADAYLNARAAEIGEAQVVVVHHEVLYAWVQVLLRWQPGVFILDEGHAFSSWDSRRSQAAKTLARATPRRWVTSGTPMTSRPRDVHNVADIVSEWRFGPFFRHEGSSFSSIFCDAHQVEVGKGPEAKTVWNFDGASNQELLGRRLSYFMLRRTAKEVDAQLPAKQRQTVDISIPPKQTIMPTGDDILKNRKALRRALDMAADGKFKQVVALIKEHVEEGSKVLVFCHRQAFTEAIVDAAGKFPKTLNVGATFVHGGVTSQKKREARIAEAEAHAGPFVFAATIESCSTAIDLSFADVAIFAELTWEPHELAQAEERIYKFGSGRKSFIQYVIAKGTGDELILRSVIAKLDDFEKIIGKTGDNMRKDLRAEKPKGSALDRLYESLMAMKKETA